MCYVVTNVRSLECSNITSMFSINAVHFLHWLFDSFLVYAIA